MEQKTYLSHSKSTAFEIFYLASQAQCMTELKKRKTTLFCAFIYL